MLVLYYKSYIFSELLTYLIFKVWYEQSAVKACILGNPRNKVGLKPGHSLMDWIRLGNSGKDLTGTGGAVLNVTKGMLAQHNQPNDAWLCIRGN